MDTPKLKELVRQVIALLVEQKYSELESLPKGIRLGADDIRQAIATYKVKLVILVREVKDAAIRSSDRCLR